MIEFKAGRIELSKWNKKYPRTTIKNKGGDREAHKIVQWVRNNWIDDRYTDMNYTKIRKFLKNNVGRPIDKVLSEFIQRCHKSIYKPKELLYSFIEEKDKIWWFRSGFYLSNGILNYKKPRKKPYKK